MQGRGVKSLSPAPAAWSMLSSAAGASGLEAGRGRRTGARCREEQLPFVSFKLPACWARAVPLILVWWETGNNKSLAAFSSLFIVLSTPIVVPRKHLFSKLTRPGFL